MAHEDPKHAVSAAIEDYIAGLEGRGENPDPFSSEYAERAIEAFHQRLLDHAKLDIARAAMPGDKRTPQEMADVDPDNEVLTTAQLRRRWDEQKRV